MTFINLKCREADIQKLENAGYALASSKNRRLGGDVYEERTYRLIVDPCTQLLQPSIISLTCIATAGCFLGACGGCYMDKSKEGIDRGHSICDTWCFEAGEGIRERTRYVFNGDESQKLFERDSRALGFDLSKAADRKSFMLTKANEIYTCLSHKFLTHHMPVSGFSSALYAIGGNFDNIEWRTHFSKTTGQSFSSADLHETAVRWCANYRPGQTPAISTKYAKFNLDKEKRNELTQPLLDSSSDVIFTRETGN